MIVMFQAGEQAFRMEVEPNASDPHDKRKCCIESLEVRISGAFVDVSGLIDVCRDDLLKLHQVDHVISRFACEQRGIRASELDLYDRAEARAINAGAA